MEIRNFIAVSITAVTFVSGLLYSVPLLKGSSPTPAAPTSQKLHPNFKGHGNLPSITTTSLPSGTVGVDYSATLAVSGGKSPYTWSVIQNQLPPGLKLSPTTGNISGVPSSPADFTFTIEVQDARGATCTATLMISIVSPQSTLAANPTSLSFTNVTVGTSAQQTLTVAASGSVNVTVSQVTVSHRG